MKIYISCDMEGVSGIADWRQVMFNEPACIQGRRLATRDLNAVVQGLIDGGATEIVAWDGHGDFPGSIDPELLHPACKLIMNGGRGGMIGIDDSFDAIAFCGLHAMAGSPGGVLAHSFTRSIAEFSVNGIQMGEIGISMLVAGAFNVPPIFIGGDLAAVQEARALVPGIEGVAVKQGLEPYGVLLRSPEEAHAALRAGAERAMDWAGKVLPYRLDPPYRMLTKWRTPEAALRASEGPGLRLINECTVEETVADLRAWKG